MSRYAHLSGRALSRQGIILTTLAARKYSWSISLNLIYVDNPSGTGYNFVRNDKDYTNNETQVAKDIHNALLRFFKFFPELRNNNFFVTDESYDDKYTSAVSYIIEDYDIKI
ncbi:hypothetical protein HZH66_011012 [Vespula vulgaris]|uniref:Uncharacterized protein n=1 Tax=Vespula vulgaris TaxID=7454 RepID=A0A834JEJ0_VESVU|nr:hypothetical protein HZH66_011012 [Vespula vulgaris]